MRSTEYLTCLYYLDRVCRAQLEVFQISILLQLSGNCHYSISQIGGFELGTGLQESCFTSNCIFPHSPMQKIPVDSFSIAEFFSCTVMLLQTLQSENNQNPRTFLDWPLKRYNCEGAQMKLAWMETTSATESVSQWKKKRQTNESGRKRHMAEETERLDKNLHSSIET